LRWRNSMEIGQQATDFILKDGDGSDWTLSGEEPFKDIRSFS